MFTRFVGDMRGALTTMGRAPALLAITLALALVSVLRGPLAIVGIVTSFFSVGWAGTQQLWAARLEMGDLPEPAIWPTTWRYFGRFFVLGLFYIPVFFVVTFFALSRRGALDHSHRHTSITGGGRVVLAVVVIALEVMLTFVFPALALTTRRVSEAWNVGWRLLRENWRRDIWYAVAPAVTLQSAYAFVAPAQKGIDVRLIVSAVLAILALVFRISIVREYMRLETVNCEQPA